MSSRAYERMLWLSVAAMLASVLFLAGIFHTPARIAIALTVIFCLLLGGGSYGFLAWLLFRPRESDT